MQAERISKILAAQGLCSRREADEYLAKGWVKVDGEVAQVGQKALPTQQITLDKAAQQRQSARATILLHKPVGYVSAQAEKNYQSAVTLITKERQFFKDKRPFNAQSLYGLAPAGRLDIDSSGLLILTQDGRVARHIIGEDSQIEKEYLVRVTGTIQERGLQLLQHGLSLDGKPLKPAKVFWQNEDQLRFILKEGKKRQIRRMCEQVGLKVIGLKRVRIGRLCLSDLPLGQWRYLEPHEKI